MSRCVLPAAAQCLWEHVRHKANAAGLKPQEGRDKRNRLKLEMLCPNHRDKKRSLSVSQAEYDSKWLVWHCHAGCPEIAVRQALVTVAHIDPGCLPVASSDAVDLLDAVVRELMHPSKEHSLQKLKAVAIALGYKEMPRGYELERLAGMVTVSPASAYKLRGASLDNP